jgi:hypothetical protein
MICRSRSPGTGHPHRPSWPLGRGRRRALRGCGGDAGAARPGAGMRWSGAHSGTDARQCRRPVILWIGEHAALGQPPPLTDCIAARPARRLAVPGPARRPRPLRNGCPQLVHGPGPDRMILGEFAIRSRVFPPARQPPLDLHSRGRLARADHSLDQDQPRRAHRPRLRSDAWLAEPAAGACIIPTFG